MLLCSLLQGLPCCTMLSPPCSLCPMQSSLHSPLPHPTPHGLPCPLSPVFHSLPSCTNQHKPPWLWPGSSSSDSSGPIQGQGSSSSSSPRPRSGLQRHQLPASGWYSSPRQGFFPSTLNEEKNLISASSKYSRYPCLVGMLHLSMRSKVWMILPKVVSAFGESKNAYAVNMKMF